MDNTMHRNDRSGTTVPEASPAPSLGDLLETVGDPHRRRVLLAVADEGRIPLDDLALGDGGGSQGLSELKRVHIPRLEQAGFVDWDRDEGTVSQGPDFAQIRPNVDNWAAYHSVPDR